MTLTAPFAQCRAVPIGMSERRWPANYEITIDGVLDDRWAAWFEGLEITAVGNRAVMSGWWWTKPHYTGLLGKVRDLGLPLISVCRRNGDDAEGGGAT